MCDMVNVGMCVEWNEMSMECVTWWMWECVLKEMKCQWNV